MNNKRATDINCHMVIDGQPDAGAHEYGSDVSSEPPTPDTTGGTSENATENTDTNNTDTGNTDTQTTGGPGGGSCFIWAIMTT